MFEVITVGGHKFRHEDGYSWEYGGDDDRVDRSIVVVYRNLADDERQLFCEYNQVIRVGDVNEETTLCMPEKRLEFAECPKCGYRNYKKDSY